MEQCSSACTCPSVRKHNNGQILKVVCITYALYMRKTASNLFNDVYAVYAQI